VFDVYNIIYLKNIFNSKFLSYDNLTFKKQLVNNIYSMRNLIITKC
jgi:hypothetical protein